MPWVTPFTAAVGDAWTAAEWNTYARDNLNFLRNAHGCRVWASNFNTGLQNINPIANATATSVPFDSEVFDSDGFHDSGSNPSRFTIPTGFDGYYTVIGMVEFAANGTGVRNATLRLNGTTVIASMAHTNAGGGTPSRELVATTYRLQAADYVELRAYQESGGNLNLTSGTLDDTQFSLIYNGL